MRHLAAGSPASRPVPTRKPRLRAAVVVLTAGALTALMPAGVAVAAPTDPPDLSPQQIAALAALPCVSGGPTAADGAMAAALNPLLSRKMRGYMTAYNTSCARAVVQAVRNRGLNPRAAAIAIATVIVETSIANLDGGDLDSVGLFQQRDTWGSHAERTNPMTATNMFLDTMQRFYPNGSWNNAPIGEVAADVQRPAAEYRGRYAEQAGDAVIIANRLWSKTASDTAGVYRPSNATFYLRDNNWAGPADITVQFGNIDDKPLVGDWDGNGTSTVGVYRPDTRYFYLRNSNTPGDAEIGFHFGNPGDIPIAGDWDGDGDETVGVYRPSNSTFYLRNNNWAGPADRTIHFGNNNQDQPVVGDWDGDGDDSVSVYRPATASFYLINSDVSTANPRIIQYGSHDDRPLTGNWNSDRYTTIGVYRPDTRYFYLRNDNTPGDAEIGFHFGNPGDIPIAGNWR
ncbi:hypothetical protein [Nonomuraea sp. SBT364]|uniref:hypothetical protein n=1 Tax=Nonomuraea sp. SBT364 TaxID=1580530 RepID=UPI000AEAF1C9|nr:hypothetical protein [Nonomuraea sp. SBT364]